MGPERATKTSAVIDRQRPGQRPNFPSKPRKKVNRAATQSCAVPTQQHKHPEQSYAAKCPVQMVSSKISDFEEHFGIRAGNAARN
jgi:hypothetical protein